MLISGLAGGAGRFFLLLLCLGLAACASSYRQWDGVMGMQTVAEDDAGVLLRYTEQRYRSEDAMAAALARRCAEIAEEAGRLAELGRLSIDRDGQVKGSMVYSVGAPSMVDSAGNWHVTEPEQARHPLFYKVNIAEARCDYLE